MSRVYQTDYWQVRLPEHWVATEVDGPAQVEVRKSGGVGALKVITTDDEPSVWAARKGEVFHGQLYGKTGTFSSEKFDRFSRWWALWCGNVTLYVYYCCPAHCCDQERLEVEEMVYNLLPRSWKASVQVS